LSTARQRLGRFVATHKEETEVEGLAEARTEFSLQAIRELAAIAVDVASTCEAALAEAARESFEHQEPEARRMSLYDTGAYGLMETISSLCHSRPEYLDPEELPLLRIALTVLDSGVRRFLAIAELVAPHYDIHKRTDEALWALTELRRELGEWYLDALPDA
jgi:hypothetical protein